MSAIAPPPLPDVPPALPQREAAPIAYASSAGHGMAPQYAERPVGAGKRFWLYLPLPVMLACVGLLLLKEFSSGADFRHDSTHVAIRLFDLALFGGIAAVPLVVGSIVLACTWRRLEPHTRRWFAAASAVALVMGLVSVPASETVFRWSKTRAYESVNPTSLTADCIAIASAAVTTPGADGEYTYQGTDPAVPAYLRSLGPKWVRVTPTGVKVIMSIDLFAGVYPEGFFVPTAPLGMSPPVYASQNRMTLISAQPPVFRYSSR